MHQYTSPKKDANIEHKEKCIKDHEKAIITLSDKMSWNNELQRRLQKLEDKQITADRILTIIENITRPVNIYIDSNNEEYTEE